MKKWLILLILMVMLNLGGVYADSTAGNAPAVSGAAQVRSFYSGIDSQSLVIDQAGNLWVNNPSVNTLTELDSSGNLIRKISITNPNVMALDASGNLWVGNSTNGTGSLTEFPQQMLEAPKDDTASKSDSMMFPLDSGITTPTYVGFDSSSNVWVSGSKETTSEVTDPGTSGYTDNNCVSVPNRWDNGYHQHCEPIYYPGRPASTYSQTSTSYETLVLNTRGDILTRYSDESIDTFSIRPYSVLAVAKNNLKNTPLDASVTDASGNTWKANDVKCDQSKNCVSYVNEFNNSGAQIGHFIYHTDSGSIDSAQAASLAIDPSGNIWISTHYEVWTNNLIKMSPSGVILASTVTGNPEPKSGTIFNSFIDAIKTDKSGNIWGFVRSGYFSFMNVRSLVEYNSSGALAATYPVYYAVNYFKDFKIDKNGNVWVSVLQYGGNAQNAVLEYNSSGLVATYPMPNPTQITLDKNGNIWVVNPGNSGNNLYEIVGAAAVNP